MTTDAPAARPAGADLRTTIGVAGESAVALVDCAGSVTFAGPVPDAGLVVQWCVRGEERWHVAGHEVTVRQRLLLGAPVPETSMRVGAGDVLWRAFGVATAAGPVAVLEVVDEGRLPVALGVVLRRTDGGPVRIATDPGATGALLIHGPATRTVLSGPRPPSALAAGPTLEAVLDRLGDGEVPGSSPVTVDGAVVVAVWPLAHGSTTGFVLPLDHRTASIRRRLDFGLLASAEQVARGWNQQLDAAAHVDWPDDSLVERSRRQRAALVLEAPALAEADAALVLDRWGHHDDAAVVLANLTDVVDLDPTVGGGLLVALAEHVRLTADRSLARAALETVIAVVDTLGRRDDAAASVVRRAAAELLAAAGEPRAASAVLAPRRRWFGAGSGARTPGASGRLLPAGEDRSPASLLRASLVVERSSAVAGGRPRSAPALADGIDRSIELSLLEGWEPRWRGTPIEAAGLPTARGRLSFALRWHGRRPALLWEIDPAAMGGDEAGVPPVLRAPALDPEWQGGGWRGEVLLAEPPGPTMPGPTMPDAVAPAGDESVTFS